MKWKRPSGTEIETLDDDVTIAQCKSMGWKPVNDSKQVTLYRRSAGEIVEGQESYDEFILESESFDEELLEIAIEEGWFSTKEAATHAPPDKPIGDEK